MYRSLDWVSTYFCPCSEPETLKSLSLLSHSRYESGYVGVCPRALMVKYGLEISLNSFASLHGQHAWERDDQRWAWPHPPGNLVHLKTKSLNSDSPDDPPPVLGNVDVCFGNVYMSVNVCVCVFMVLFVSWKCMKESITGVSFPAFVVCFWNWKTYSDYVGTVCCSYNNMRLKKDYLELNFPAGM